MPSILLAADSPLGHVLDHGHVWSEMQWVGEFGLTIHAVMLVISAVTLLAAMALAASRIATGPESMGNERFVTKGRIAQVVEVLVIGLRDQMIEPILGEKQTRRWLPFLLSMFFFILVINLYGLVPLQDLQDVLGLYSHGADGHKLFWLGGTSTANINVTLAFAFCAFLAIQIHSFRELGIIGWLDHLTCGLFKSSKIVYPVIPVVFAVELAGVFIKPVALAIRLFANMMGGHILLATVLMLPTLMGLQGAAWFGVTFATGAFAVALTFLELFVAFLQAFVFMFLTAVFLSLMSHEEHEHEDHAAEEVAHELAHAH